jgi:hypothetical protein
MTSSQITSTVALTSSGNGGNAANAASNFSSSVMV